MINIIITECTPLLLGVACRILGVVRVDGPDVGTSRFPKIGHIFGVGGQDVPVLADVGRSRVIANEENEY